MPHGSLRDIGFSLALWFALFQRISRQQLSFFLVRSPASDLMMPGSLRQDGSLPIGIELVNVPRMLKDVRHRRLGPELHLIPHLVQV